MRSGSRPPRPRPTPAEPADLLERLLAGDEELFAALVERFHPALRGLAESLTGNGASAEELVQETWALVLRSLRTFERRSSFRTWTLRICTHVALARLGHDEGTPVPVGSSVDSDRFDELGAWRDPPAPWKHEREAMDCIRRAVVTLPMRQRAVITLRDIHGFSPDEACEILGVSQGDQRVLLHHARTQVRAECERFYREAA